MIFGRENGYSVVVPLYDLPFLFREIRRRIHFVELFSPIDITIVISYGDDGNN